MDRPLPRTILNTPTSLLLVLGLLLALGGGTGCRAVRPNVLPVVGSMGDPGNGQPWDDLDLYLIDPVGGGAAVRVTNTPDLMETDPDLNRDRDRLVYVERGVNAGVSLWEGRRDGRTDDSSQTPPGLAPSRLIVCAPDGADRRVLRRSDNMCFTPVWSNDGKRIAFVETNDEGRLEVKLINADGSGLQTVGYGSQPSWRKDDQALFYSSIDRPDMTEGNLLLRELTTGVFHELGLPGTGHTNLRNGVSVAYSSTPYSRRNETIWLMDALGGEFRLTDPAANERDLQPVFFGGEGDVVFTRYDDEAGTAQLMRINRKTDDRIATPIDQPTPLCFTRGGLWVAKHYPR